MISLKIPLKHIPNTTLLITFTGAVLQIFSYMSSKPWYVIPLMTSAVLLGICCKVSKLSKGTVTATT